MVNFTNPGYVSSYVATSCLLFVRACYPTSRLIVHLA
jgi:hypothetical protein